MCPAGGQQPKNRGSTLDAALTKYQRLSPIKQSGSLRYRVAGGNNHFDQCTRVRVGYSQLSAKLPGSLFYASDADSDAIWLESYHPLVNSPAVILY
jgi:hypothetical protein